MKPFSTLGFRLAGEIWRLQQPPKWSCQSDMNEHGPEYPPRGSSHVMTHGQNKKAPLQLPTPTPVVRVEPLSAIGKGSDQKLQEGLLPTWKNNDTPASYSRAGPERCFLPLKVLGYWRKLPVWNTKWTDGLWEKRNHCYRSDVLITLMA